MSRPAYFRHEWPDYTPITTETLELAAARRDLAAACQRIEEMEADVELGKLVRGIPRGMLLYHSDVDWPDGDTRHWHVWAKGGKPDSGMCDTPEIALREALGEEQDAAI